ncbi:60S ribosomal protein L28 [Eumeta japonica]|uniref:Large ribosomal subunit protein eL28 n=1 Tax=Eumeta variegata TaxID=151549 RepID=A0A4C1W1Z1_EUMVA|nr:60S ribosomal protein L28 [Eumeta japonica]
MSVSPHLSWMIIRNNNAFLVKKRDIKKPFSKEPNNVTNLNSFRYNGLVHKKTVGVVENPDRKGFTIVYKKAKAANKPAKNTVRCQFKAGARRSLFKVKRLLKANHYRTDLTKATLRRASAILRSQRPIKAKKPKSAAAKSE